MARLKKIRADQRLVELGLAPTRSKAAAMILAGEVYAGEKRIAKAGQAVAADAALRVKAKDHPWVGRGGVKLAHGLKHFDLSLDGMIVLDIGASTGGFTDVALKHGAAKVYAVDVGKGQLDAGLRSNPRVVVMEETNARHLAPGNFPEAVDAIVCDASFISLATLLPGPLTLLKPGGLVIALIKPQFEAGRKAVAKGGVVREAAIQRQVCEGVRAFLTSQGLTVLGLTESPITGPKGNREFLIAARKP
jgi:23S rRNA (cytidine1920-2'-O)/16S rRNA (cytidine1409-2'-O)-methyltransferase